MDKRNLHAPRSLAAVAVGCLLFGFASVAVTADLSAGKKVFTQTAQPSCTVCHTLADAGSTGAIGPNLDTLKPNKERVYRAVTDGIGVMPPYKGKLSENERKAVAEYVAGVTGDS